MAGGWAALGAAAPPGLQGSRQQDGQCSYPLQRVGPGAVGAA